MGVLDSALDFINRGFYVFPTYAKTPIMKDWPNLATNDPDTAIEWFTNEYSNADGFGICPKDTCFVLDIDIKDGKKGIDSLKLLIQEFGLPKDTFKVRTKSGGMHIYYSYPTSLKEDQYIKSVVGWTLPDGRKLDGIDIRGNKGQVIGPTDDNNYAIITDTSLKELPQSIVDLLPIESNYGLKPVDAHDADSLIAYDKPTMGGMIPDVIPKGERHDTLLSLTASWARKLPYETAKILLQVACDRCEGSVAFEDYLSRLDDAYAKFEPVVKDKLQYMLDHMVYVTWGSRVYRKDKPGNVATIKLDEARNVYKNWLIWDERVLANGDTKKTSREAFSDWLKHPDRQTVENVGFKPVTEERYICPVLGVEVINSYRKPDHLPVIATDKHVKPFVDLVQHLWGDHSEIMLNWCAHLVQHPTIKFHWAPLIVTPVQGMGKNLFFKIISQVLGMWNTSIVNAAMLNKTFNTFLVENLLVLINEVQEIGKSDRRAMMGKLKGYVTESQQSIEGKSANIYQTEIFANVIIFSNVEDAMDIEDEDRRWFIHINYDRPQPESWYNNIVSWMDNEGASYLYHWLMNRDISGFKATGHAPASESKLEMIRANKTEVELIIEDHIATSYSIFGSNIVTQQSWEYYVKHVLHKGGRLGHAQEKFLKKKYFVGVKTLNSSNGKYISCQVMMPNIASMSDIDVVIEDRKSSKTTCWTCRNHGSYDNRTTKEIREEYMKIFSSSGSTANNITNIA